jgi:O-methyltransferase
MKQSTSAIAWKRAAPVRAYAENLAMVNVVLANMSLKNGAIIECGTWKGGMAAGMIEIAGPDRRYYFFDSFEGLPPARDRRNESKAVAGRPDPSDDNCKASLEDFQNTIKRTGYQSEAVEIHKGFFENTLPAFDCPPMGPRHAGRCRPDR